MTAKVVFHIDWDEEARLLMALGNITNLFKEIPHDQASVFVLANGKSVGLFCKDRASSYRTTVENLATLGVHFLVCKNSLAGQGIQDDDVLEVCEPIPAGIVKLVALQSEGYAYVKP